MRLHRLADDFTPAQYRVSRPADGVTRSGKTASSLRFREAGKPEIINRGGGRASAGIDGARAARMEFFYERKNNLFCVQSLN